MPPTGIPRPTYATALPRFLTNHFNTGTVVTNAPGPLIPTSPITTNNTTKCHAEVTYANPINAPPVASAATGNITREPYRSSNQPINGLVAELAPCRAVCAHPNAARPIPNSSPIGLMNNPKFNEPIPMLTAPSAAITATITHP